MRDFFFREQQAQIIQMFRDFRIGFEDVFPSQPFRGRVVEESVEKNGAVDWKPFAQAGFIVVFAMTRRGVDSAGALFVVAASLPTT